VLVMTHIHTHTHKNTHTHTHTYTHIHTYTHTETPDAHTHTHTHTHADTHSTCRKPSHRHSTAAGTGVTTKGNGMGWGALKTLVVTKGNDKGWGALKMSLPSFAINGVAADCVCHRQRRAASQPPAPCATILRKIWHVLTSINWHMHMRTGHTQARTYTHILELKLHVDNVTSTYGTTPDYCSTSNGTEESVCVS
jgi:hypothetical protein